MSINITTNKGNNGQNNLHNNNNNNNRYPQKLTIEITYLIIIAIYLPNNNKKNDKHKNMILRTCSENNFRYSNCIISSHKYYMIAE